jgi:hypothetical protein
MTFDEIMEQFASSTSSANAANKARFNEALELLTGTQASSEDAYRQAYDLLGNLGATSRMKIGDAATKAEGQGTQSAVSGGLYNTTMLDSVLRDIASGKESALTDLESAVAAQKSSLLTQGADVNTQIASSISDLYKSAYDNAPNAQMWAELATQASSAPSGKYSSGGGSRGLNDVTDTMNQSSSSGGVGTVYPHFEGSGEPTGSTWGSEPTTPSQVSPNALRWEGNTLTNMPQSTSELQDTSTIDSELYDSGSSYVDDLMSDIEGGDSTESGDGIENLTPEELEATIQGYSQEEQDAMFSERKKGELYWDTKTHTWQPWMMERWRK